MPTRALAPALAALLIVVGVALLLGPSDARSAAGAWSWPVEGEVLTPYRNGSDPYAGGQHRGIDIAAGVGAPAVAAASGTVRFRGVTGSNGLTVSVRTADGRFDTSYLHLDSASVEKGQVVQAGERIGTVGVSGRRSADAPHLHFGVREAGSRHAYVDPLTLLGPLPVPAPAPAEPRGVPVPVQAPVPAAPAPVPVRVPVARPVGSPAPVRVPAGRRVRVPAGRRVGVPGARRVPSHSVGLAPARPAPVRVRAPAPAGVSEPPPTLRPLGELGKPSGHARPHGSSAVPALGPGAGAIAPARRSPAAAVADPSGSVRGLSEPGPAASGGRGPDAGWALACVGLLLAAACIGGRPSGERKPAARGGTLRSLLRP
ncbi:MAG: peptidoglycan DD-metalloendopeptidase family protein [Thermoleophilaceae bacterium]